MTTSGPGSSVGIGDRIPVWGEISRTRPAFGETSVGVHVLQRRGSWLEVSRHPEGLATGQVDPSFPVAFIRTRATAELSTQPLSYQHNR